MELERNYAENIPRKNVFYCFFLIFAFLIFVFLAIHKKIKRQRPNIPKPIHAINHYIWTNIDHTSKQYRQVGLKKIIITAPKRTKRHFFSFFKFTLAAVILSNPGGVIPIKAVIKPESKDIIKFIGTLSAFTKEPIQT
jgi:hypothetical protein